jgi:hypothetical protein
MNQEELLRKEIELSNINSALGRLIYIFTVYKEKDENYNFFSKKKEEVSSLDKKKRYLCFTHSNLLK